MKKQLLFAGAFFLGLGAFGLLSSFDDGEQAKIDAKYEELKTKFMEEQMQKCQETADEEAMRLYKEENPDAPVEETVKSSGGNSTRPVAPNSGSATSGSEGSSATTPTEEATSGGATKDPQKGRGGATTKGDADAQKQRGGATTTNDAASQKRRPGAN